MVNMPFTPLISTALQFFLFSTLTFLFLAAPLSARTTLRVGIYQNQPKIFFDEDKQPAGFYPEILQHIAEKENWNIKYIPCEWSNCLQQLGDGTIDLMPDVAWTEDRAKRFSLNHEDVLYSFSRVYASTVNDFTSIFDMDGKRIGVLKDSFQARQLRLSAKSYAIQPTLVEADDFTTVFELLSNNNVDGIIVNHFAGERYKAKYKAAATGLVLFPSRLHFATAPGKHAELLARIDTQLLQLKKILTQSITRAWLNVSSPLP